MMQKIPDIFNNYKEKIASSEIEYIRIFPKPKEQGLLPWQSKFLGQPYLPKAQEYPKDTAGNPLHFLAQINFSEIPKLAPFPEKGILQFYVAADEMLGLEFAEPYDPVKQFQLQTSASNFRVIYFEEITEDIDKLQLSSAPVFEYSPIETESCLAFEIRKEYVPIADIQFDRLVGEDIFNKNGEFSSDLWDIYSDSINSTGCKIGGYASFCQDDVRHIAPNHEEWLLLLQLDYTAEVDIMWGDAGVGNFFIEKGALEKLDFSHVLYNWDCA